MSDRDFMKLVDNALEANDKLTQYSNYPPISNSRQMLLEISEHRDNKDYLFMSQARLNVGLLAAKALDFERDYDRGLYAYATILHDVWNSVLNLVGQPFPKPKSGPKKLAYDFYVQHNYIHNQIINHLSGIDFNFPVGTSILNKTLVVGQWKIPPIPQGDYYTDINNSIKPDCL